MTTTATPVLDHDQIRRTLALLIEPEQVVEVRAIDTSRYEKDWPHTASGYFTDTNKLLKEIEQAGKAKAVWISLNRLNPNLLARTNNRISHAKDIKTTADEDVTARRLLLIDADPERKPKDIPASNEEHEAALERAREIRGFLDDMGWPEPVFADSGNGGHLLYRIDLPTQDDGLVRHVLEALAHLFDDEEIKIDQTVYNPARMCKLYGTWACKGDNAPEVHRVHRISQILDSPEQLEPVQKSLLLELAERAPSKQSSTPSQPIQPDTQSVIQRFLTKHDISAGTRASYRNGGKWLLKECPFCHNTDHCAVVYEWPDGTLGFHCSHNSCKEKHWQEFRLHFEPDAYTRKEQYQEYKPGSSPPGNGHQPGERHYQLHPLSYLKGRPKRAWGVEKLIYDRGSAIWAGDSGSGKSAFVLNMNLSRVCGIDFVGRKTKPGFLIWIAAESIDDIYPRVAAFLACHKIPEDQLTNALFIDETVPFNNVAEISDFIESVKAQLSEMGVAYQDFELSFAFDTYARCTPGANENDTQETKLISDTTEMVCSAFNAHVDFIHHTNAQGKIRGSTVFKAGADVVWVITKDKETMTIECLKMRGHPEPETFTVVMRSVVIDETNLEESAPVIFPSDAPDLSVSVSRSQLDVLSILYESGSLASNEWYRRCEKAYRMPYSTWNNHKKTLEDYGFVETPLGAARGQKKVYTVTPLGEDLL